MSLPCIILTLGCLCSWAGGVNSAAAQVAEKPAKTDKMVRVTYPVADLIKQEVLAETLMRFIANAVAPKSWEQAGGDGTMQYFPFGTAIVVYQPQPVQEEVARFLTDLRRMIAALEGSLDAQVAAKPAKTDKIVRVTYPISGLIVPILDHTCFEQRKPAEGTKTPTRDELAEELKDRITRTIAKTSWECFGGNGNIQYFPFGMAVVVNQTKEVQEEVALLLAKAHRARDVQIGLQVRVVRVAAKTAARIRRDGKKQGQPLRAESENAKVGASPFTVDDKHLVALLEMVQGDRSAHIITAPMLTLFDGQLGNINAMSNHHGIRFDARGVVAPDRTSIRLSLDFEFAMKVGSTSARRAIRSADTFVVPADRSLVWFLGEVGDTHLFVIATPHVVMVVEEEKIFLSELQPTPVGDDTNQKMARMIVKDGFLFLEKANDLEKAKHCAVAAKGLKVTFAAGERSPDDLLREIQRRQDRAAKPPLGGTEEQAIPEPKKQPSAKQKVIEYRLRQPINFHFKEMPLKVAVQNLTTLAGIPIVLDTKALRDARIDQDSPITFHAPNFDMKAALKLMLGGLDLAYLIENDVLIITTAENASPMASKTYNVGALMKIMTLVEGDAKAESLKDLIHDTVATKTWESMGGRGNIQYFPLEKKLVINQYNEVHEEIDLLLECLRRLYYPSVDVETRIVQTSAGTATQLRKFLAKQGKSIEVVESEKSRALASIDEEQVVELLKVVQDDRMATVTQFAELTLLNGQTGGCNQPTFSKWRTDIQTVVSPDRRSVRLKVNLEHRATDESRSVERLTKASKTVSVPDGRTLVWDLGERAGRQHVFVLVMPRIRTHEQSSASP